MKLSRMIKWTAPALAAGAIAVPGAMAMPVIGDGPGYSGEVAPASTAGKGLGAPHGLAYSTYSNQAAVPTASTGSGFDWTYVEAGLGGAFGLLLLTGGAIVVLRRSGEPKPLGA